MAFDAGMMTAVANEISERLVGCKIEKIYGPSRDEVLIHFRPFGGREGGRLLICAGANSPRIQLTRAEISNPAQPPVFIQLLRKHLTGAKLIEARQQGFERAVELVFEAHDEMEFRTTEFLIVEIMGKYSNVMLCDSGRKILSAIKVVDITTSQKRQVLPGMIYEEPPKQDKFDPFEENESGFVRKYNEYQGAPDKFVLQIYAGISPLVAREITHDCEGDAYAAWGSFENFRRIVASKEYVPTLVRDDTGNPCEYSFMPIRQYGSDRTERADDFADLLDKYFAERSRTERTLQRARDLHKLIENASARLCRKLDALRGDLADCAGKEDLKRKGDLITSNIHVIKRGDSVVTVTDYYDEAMPQVTISLDARLSPSANAQKYYKKYNKLKTAEVELSRQIATAETELDYIRSVADEFSRAEGEAEIAEIKREMYAAGYGRQMRNYTPQKVKDGAPREFVTDGGYRLLCGRNNLQNDRLVHRTASKGDYWFHVKDAHGSHVVMLCDGMPEPGVEDFTQAAMVAAYYSEQRSGKNVEVDYTLVRNLKKPPQAKPGFVIYHTNYSAVVTPDREAVERIAKK